MDNGINKVERWNNEVKSLMFAGIIVLTLIVFFGSFYLFL